LLIYSILSTETKLLSSTTKCSTVWW